MSSDITTSILWVRRWTFILIVLKQFSFSAACSSIKRLWTFKPDLLDLNINDTDALAKKADSLFQSHQSSTVNNLSDNLHTTIHPIRHSQQRAHCTCYANCFRFSWPGAGSTWVGEVDCDQRTGELNSEIYMSGIIFPFHFIDYLQIWCFRFDTYKWEEI